MIVDWETPVSRERFLEMIELKDDGALHIIIWDRKDKNENYFYFTFRKRDAYRNTDEGYLQDLWEERDKTTKNIGKTFIYDESPWINEMMKDVIFQIHADSLSSPLVHYVIITDSDVVEVISAEPPEIRSATTLDD